MTPDSYLHKRPHRDNPLVRLVRGEITTEEYVHSVKDRVDALLEAERKAKPRSGVEHRG